MTDDSGQAVGNTAKRNVPLWRHILVRLVQAGLAIFLLFHVYALLLKFVGPPGTILMTQRGMQGEDVRRDWTSLDKIKPAFDVLDAHDGEAVAESFTIQPGKAGEVATIAAKVGKARVLANSTDPAVCAELRKGKVSGRAVRIEEGEGGVNRFWFI